MLLNPTLSALKTPQWLTTGQSLKGNKTGNNTSSGEQTVTAKVKDLGVEDENICWKNFVFANYHMQEDVEKLHK